MRRASVEKWFRLFVEISAHPYLQWVQCMIRAGDSLKLVTHCFNWENQSPNRKFVRRKKIIVTKNIVYEQECRARWDVACILTESGEDDLGVWWGRQRHSPAVGVFSRACRYLEVKTRKPSPLVFSWFGARFRCALHMFWGCIDQFRWSVYGT